MYALKVEKMSCGGCAARVTRAVQSADPDAKVAVRLQDRLVMVESDFAPEVIADAISTAGYPASKAETT
jgi:copper chaperone